MSKSANILIAGVPGSGKSSVGEKLAQQGYPTIDTDDYPGPTNWVNRKTKIIATPPAQGMTKEWIKQHDYNWDETLLKELLSNTDNGQIFYGSSSNQEALLDLFDTVFLLKVDPVTIIDRLKRRSDNKYGKTQAERDHVLTWYQTFQDKYAQNDRVIVIDATQPLSNIVRFITSTI